MKTALVIGGAGFLGSRIVQDLRQSGCEVVIVDPLHLPHPLCFEDVNGATLGRFDYVFHAGATLTKHNVFDRGRMGMDAFQDVELDYSVARYLEGFPPRERAVWFSSSAVDTYDTENYSFVKYVGERFAKNLAKHNVPISILRPFGGYGPGQSLEYPFPAILHRALKREDPLTVWGSTHTVRDWIWVDDLIHAVMMAASNPKWPVGVPVEIGTGVPTTFGQLARKVAAAVGYHPMVLANSTMPTSSHSRVAHIGPAMELGFRPEVNLDEGIRRMLDAATPS